jgi:glyoxylase-like metal-dependent hydrolase (beta-lactamase superfamily II)
MFVKGFSTGLIDTNSYLLACLSSKLAIVIDAGQNSAEKLISCAERHQLQIVKILLTHSHWDHIADIAVLKKSLHVPIYVHQKDASNVQNPGFDGLPLQFVIEGVEVDHYLADGEIIDLGNLHMRVIHTPGHSPGCVCFYEESQKVLFSGDTLFQGTIGRIDLPTACPFEMLTSLQKLKALPKETVVYPGHGDKTTIGQELSNIHKIEKILHKRG